MLPASCFAEHPLAWSKIRHYFTEGHCYRQDRCLFYLTWGRMRLYCWYEGDRISRSSHSMPRLPNPKTSTRDIGSAAFGEIVSSDRGEV